MSLYMKLLFFLKVFFWDLLTFRKFYKLERQLGRSDEKSLYWRRVTSLRRVTLKVVEEAELLLAEHLPTPQYMLDLLPFLSLIVSSVLKYLC